MRNRRTSRQRASGGDDECWRHKELIDHDSHAWLSNVDTTEFANHLQNALQNPNTDQYRLR